MSHLHIMALKLNLGAVQALSKGRAKQVAKTVDQQSGGSSPSSASPRSKPIAPIVTKIEVY